MDNKVKTLELVRAKKNKLNRKQYLNTEDRLKELEEDMLRVIEMCLYLEATVEYQEKLIKQIIKGLKDEMDASSSSSKK